MEAWSTHQLIQQGKDALDTASLTSLRQYAQALKAQRLPVVFTLNHLAKITGVPYPVLLNTVNRKRETANYKMFAISKRSGGRRHIHAVHKHLHRVHQFINQEILQKVQPHYAAQAFHPGGGIRQCAQMHCGARWLFQFDLQDFFYSVNETAVYEVFKGLGYKPLLAFEFARLCTTTRLPQSKKSLLAIDHRAKHLKKYKLYSLLNKPIGVLPQGAATSPMLSNLVTMPMDQTLEKLANELGAVYTRYADDITLSLTEQLPSGITTGDIHRKITRAITQHGFELNKKKTRVAGPGSKKVVLGLLVDGQSPRLSKQMYKRIERLIYACGKFGLEATARHEGFDSVVGFENHLAGLIAFTKDVDVERWGEFSQEFYTITPYVSA